MLKWGILFVAMLSSCFTINAQRMKPLNNDSTDYYYEIPAYPDSYTSGNVAARVVDGLGFRYYWATHGLTAEDLAFKPNEEARTTNHTLDHIYSLTLIVLNAVSGKANDNNDNPEQWGFEEKRTKTIENIQRASELLKGSSEKDLNNFMMVFNRGERTTEYPFWNVLNGPIADALWHVGQVVSFRRSSGNPLNSKASMLNGKLRN